MSKNYIKKLHSIIEQTTGKSIREICDAPLYGLNKNKTIKTRICFPIIGRGNVLRENVISHQQIEKDLDAILINS